mmetsp:Transcript_57370/g.134736  ORF Transcript_57370/g.134736 Transcript_57370/m.134736 type:complete len:217 (+) Transcript_57370:210-860(+)|eukprot:3925743-Rhodomonas_salina.1
MPAFDAQGRRDGTELRDVVDATGVNESTAVRLLAASHGDKQGAISNAILAVSMHFVRSLRTQELEEPANRDVSEETKTAAIQKVVAATRLDNNCARRILAVAGWDAGVAVAAVAKGEQMLNANSSRAKQQPLGPAKEMRDNTRQEQPSANLPPRPGRVLQRHRPGPSASASGSPSPDRSVHRAVPPSALSSWTAVPNSYATRGKGDGIVSAEVGFL